LDSGKDAPVWQSLINPMTASESSNQDTGIPKKTGQMPAFLRYRIEFSKTGPLRYTSHLDLGRIWERTLRRAGLPVAYSQGFNPRPLIQLAATLPLGCESTCELIDVWLEGEAPPPEELIPLLSKAAPEGLTIRTIQAVNPNDPPLQTRTQAAVYHASIGDQISRQELEGRVASLLAQPEVWRTRRNRCYDLRPLIHELSVLPASPLILEMKLALSQEKGTGRPDEVLEALGLEAQPILITRTAIIMKP
jgi:radical SAM-linked protein